MKIVLLVLAVGFLLALLFPRRVPRLFRRAGKSVRDVGSMGKEIATGEEVRGSPLARYETRAGQLLATKLLREHPPCRDLEIQKTVAGIGSALAAHALRKEIPYRFLVVESREPNAFAVAGGSIFVTRQLVELCAGNSNRIAGALAHEIVHVDRRHAILNLTATTALRAGLAIFSLGRAALLGRICRGMEELLVRGYRQDQELEADALGVRIAHLAGFDPRGLLDVLEILWEKQPEGTGVVAEIFGYLKAHPPVPVRIEALRKEIARLEKERRGPGPG